MMALDDLLRALDRAGIRMFRCKDELHLRGDVDDLPPDVVDAARSHKLALLPLLTEEIVPPSRLLSNAIDRNPGSPASGERSQEKVKTAEEIQVAVDELVRKFGGNLRHWPEFDRVVAAAGLEPKDVTDDALAAASLHLHQRGEQFRETIKAANDDPTNPLKVVIKGDPELDPTLGTSSPALPGRVRHFGRTAKRETK